MLDYTVNYVSLPGRVKGFSTRGVNDDYVIFINQNLNYEQQRDALKHELEHIKNGDLDGSGSSVATIEHNAHHCA